MQLKEYQFGFADAEKEYTRIPGFFDAIFFDPNSIIDKLIQDYHYLLIGRKGCGKTAYSCKLKSIAERDKSIYTYSIKLNDFEFSNFSKTSIDSDFLGTQKYKQSWDFMLLLAIYRAIYNDLKITENDELNRMVTLLKSLGFSMSFEYKKYAATLKKFKLGANIGVINAKFEEEYGNTPSNYLERIGYLIDKMLKPLSEFALSRKLIILIDGADDILRYKKYQLDIISSLIRSIDYLNDLFFGNTNIKIILFIREDILSSFTDPDLNKIKRDSSITLSWNDASESLKKLICLRFQYSGIPEDQLEGMWYEIFPKLIKDKDSWTYILDYTLNRPRDILQFLKCCQELYPNNLTLTYSEIKLVLKYYANIYFVEEMKNELAGFIDDSIICALPPVLQHLGTRSFSYQDFKNAYADHLGADTLKEPEIKRLLLLLFDSSYIGHLFRHESSCGSMETVIFKYRNPTAQIDYKQKFITHRGVYHGLGTRV